MSGKNQNLSFQSKDRSCVSIDAEIDPAIGKKLKEGIYSVVRIHSLVMGFLGCGKTCFLLSMIK
ncbi:MAG: hypothetical protein FWH37_05220 [Candidatus Bathyarchaeota archaeon]|nr:hypothetical protein [Candidatus Termiticorpusculum sp.]